MATLYTSAVDFLVKFKGKDHSSQFIFLILIKISNNQYH